MISPGIDHRLTAGGDHGPPMGRFKFGDRRTADQQAGRDSQPGGSDLRTENESGRPHLDPAAHGPEGDEGVQGQS